MTQICFGNGWHNMKFLKLHICTIPICSMYGIFTFSWVMFNANVAKLEYMEHMGYVQWSKIKAYRVWSSAMKDCVYFVNLCMYACMYVCMYACMHVYVYIHIYICMYVYSI